MDGADERQRVADGLRRIDDLVAALDQVGDAAAQAAARELAGAILDVHGLALARMMAIVADCEGGRELAARLAEDEQVKAILLLYGLHPEEPRLRLQRALDRLRPRLAAHGIDLDLAHVSAAAAAVRVVGAGAADAALRGEIEQTIVDAVPELDEIVVEWRDADVSEAAALPDFRISDAEWHSLGLPIDIAFIFDSTPEGRPVALYPGPLGATQSLLGLIRTRWHGFNGGDEVWQAIDDFLAGLRGPAAATHGGRS